MDRVASCAPVSAGWHAFCVKKRRMPRYLVRNRQTEVVYEVEAWCAEAAFRRLGWEPTDGIHVFFVLRDGFETNRREPPLRLWSA